MAGWALDCAGVLSVVALDVFLDYVKQFGPWLVLLGYYFFRLDRQLLRIIELLEDQRNLQIARTRLNNRDPR